jgi:hypothetical protein
MRPYRKALTMFAARYVMRAIYRCDGNVSVAARELGLSRAQMYRILRRDGITRVSRSTYQRPSRALHRFVMSPGREELHRESPHGRAS